MTSGCGKNVATCSCRRGRFNPTITTNSELYFKLSTARTTSGGTSSSARMKSQIGIEHTMRSYSRSSFPFDTAQPRGVLRTR
jgi:hypothetical protein